MKTLEGLSSKGFALFELLTVIAILGLLAVMASPSYLRYVYNSKNTEARINIATINKAQIAKRQESNTFEPANLGNLGIQIDQKHTYFTYKIDDITNSEKAVIRATPNARYGGSLKSFLGAVVVFNNQKTSVIKSIVCESTSPIGTYLPGSALSISNSTNLLSCKNNI